jgi:SAM-dependent methyltransferase
MTAFDTLAPTYDHDFTHTPLGLILRQKAQARLQRFLRPGMRVLELGCGTGEDARWIGEQGVSLIATDASNRMREQAQAKTLHFPHLQIEALDMNQPPMDWPKIQFDLVFSHFGALNCVADVRPLAHWLSSRVAVGGHVCLMVMSPTCLWERLWYMARANPGMALRRRHTTFFQPHSMQSAMAIHYPAIESLMQAFEPDFRTLYAEPMGLFIPPSELFGMVEKRPWLKRALLAMEARFGDRHTLARWADHYTLVLERV